MNWREAESTYDRAATRETLAATAMASAREHAQRVAQRYKGGIYDRSLTATNAVDAAPAGEYADVTYREFAEIIRRLTAGFRELGVEPGDRIGMFAHTRMEWAHADFAVLAAGGVTTTVYTTSSRDQLQYLLDDPDADGVVVENRELFDRLTAVEDDLDLSFVVLMDGDPHEREDVHTLGELYETGDEQLAADAPTDDAWLTDREPEDPASLIYTSGTTGQPKGAVLTQRNFLSNVRQTAARFGPRPDKRQADVPYVGPGTTTLSFLPLAHVFERLSGHFFSFAVGATVAYAESPDTLREDFKLVEPDTAISVPRVYEKLYAAIREQASQSSIKHRIFRWATDVAREYHHADEPGPGLRARHAIADRLVFSTVRAALGGNVEFFISGGGSLSPDLCALYHGMGVPVLEGYGLTETSPVVSANPYEEPRVGTIGPPVPDVDVRLDERVTAGETDGRVGELLVRGPNVFDGYWNDPDATDAAFVTQAALEAADGGQLAATDTESIRWFRTGDVVRIEDDGYMRFRERAKQLLKLSTGKYVPPGPIEDGFAAAELIEQAMVVGDARKFVGAILVLDTEAVRSWADGAGIDLPSEPDALCADDRVRDRVAEAVADVNDGFEPHERIKQFRLVTEPFTEDNDLLTPTMKKKRRNIREHYAEEIDAIYAED